MKKEKGSLQEKGMTRDSMRHGAPKNDAEEATIVDARGRI